MPEYENRLVLFIDFLGFSEHVARTVEDSDFLDHLVDALQQLREVGMEEEVFQSQQMTHFSDSVAISYRVEETSVAFWLLTQIELAVITLAQMGFLVRGAVTVGQLYHTQDVLVGPAMVEAYRLESEVAFYPRVVIDPAVFQVARDFPSEIHEPDEEEAYVRDGLVEDPDGTIWMDYVSSEAVQRAGGDTDLYPEYLERLGVMIRNGLSHSHPRVLRKYLWLRQLYATEVIRCAEAPPSQEYDVEMQRQFMAALPLFTNEAEAAQAVVDAA